MKTVILMSVAAAAITLSATAAFAGPYADGNTPDFYAIQRGLPYAGARGPIGPAYLAAVPQSRSAHRVFLNGYQHVHKSGHGHDILKRDRK